MPKGGGGVYSFHKDFKQYSFGAFPHKVWCFICKLWLSLLKTSQNNTLDLVGSGHLKPHFTTGKNSSSPPSVVIAAFVSVKMALVLRWWLYCFVVNSHSSVWIMLSHPFWMSPITESEHDITFLIVHLSEGSPVLIECLSICSIEEKWSYEMAFEEMRVYFSNKKLNDDSPWLIYAWNDGCM